MCVCFKLLKAKISVFLVLILNCGIRLEDEKEDEEETENKLHAYLSPKNHVGMANVRHLLHQRVYDHS